MSEIICRSISNGREFEVPNDYFRSLHALRAECNSYTQAEARYTELLAEHDKQVRAENTSCIGCKHEGQWENEIEYGYPSPCVRCRRRCVDNYEIAEQSKEQKQ